MNRIAVRYKNRPLMPMKCSRIDKFVESGKGKIKYDNKLDIFYLQLLVKPSGFETQDIAIGLDPGSCFDGFSVISADCHHLNFELKQRDKKGRNSISSFKVRQAEARRTRRTRLRHRKIRFDSRNKSNLTPTIRANYEFRIWIIQKLLKYFPITKIGIEDVRFNHYANKNGRLFSHAEQGKTKLYHEVQNLGLELMLFNGWNTKDLRLRIFDYDPKISDKCAESFYAHCIDSFVIGLVCVKSDKKVIINRRVVYLEKIVRQRRRLFRTKAARYNGNNRYYRLLKNGIKEYYSKISRKPQKIRVKPSDIHSNHPKSWIYQNLGFDEKLKMKTSKYGGKPTPKHVSAGYENRKITRSNK
jgi:hypothetical protein